MITPEELYAKFENSVAKADGGVWVLAVFEGSPEADAYSWCSDCVAASGDLRSFLSDYRGPVKVLQFKVGSREEWEGERGPDNPFKARFPHLSDLPTAVLFRGKLDVARISAPKKGDLHFLVGRASVFEEQKADQSWSPPR